jgi:hypothetical protein
MYIGKTNRLVEGKKVKVKVKVNIKVKVKARSGRLGEGKTDSRLCEGKTNDASFTKLTCIPDISF